MDIPATIRKIKTELRLAMNGVALPTCVKTA